MSGRDETDEEFDKRMEDIRKAGPGPIIQEMKDKENRARAQKTASPTAPLPPVLAPKKKTAPVKLEPAIPRSPEHALEIQEQRLQLGLGNFPFDGQAVFQKLDKNGKPVKHTHLHIDHAGKDDLFPMNTTVVINRKEMEFSVSGIMYPQYPKPDILHLVERIYEPEAMRFLDLEITTAEEIIPGVWCEAAGAHTEGSMNVIVETAEGLACICGDVIYDFNDQIVNHVNTNNDMEPRVTGNHSQTKREEKGAIKKLLNNYTFLLPIHDRPAKIEKQKVVGRLGMTVPGPMTETLPDRPWFAA